MLALARALRRAIHAGNDTAMVLHISSSPSASAMGDRNMLGYLHRACKRAGVPRVSPHALRHTAGSTMLARREQIVDVAAVLGHANPLTTASIYAHSFDEGKRSAVNAARSLAHEQEFRTTARYQNEATQAAPYATIAHERAIALLMEPRRSPPP
jgi:integrase